jgi:NADH-quinone oxidoreductase subunit M
MFPYISSILAVLVLGSLVAFLTKTREQARNVALVSTWTAFVLSAIMFLTYRSAPVSITGMRFEEVYAWIPSIGIGYHVGVDGIGMPMLLLSTLICALCALYAWGEHHRANQFFGLLVLMDAALCGVFVALDFFVFYLFWELTLIPMFFLIGIWGGPRKDYSSIKFLIYTHVASVIMVISIFALYYFHGQATGNYTFDMLVLLEGYAHLGVSPFWMNLIFFGIMFGFMVKMPSVPFHTWLPDAHVEAPTIGSIILAGVLLKMGSYGLIRVLVPMFPYASPAFIYIIAILGLLSILYSPLAALAQKDLKKLVAFSSIGHMGFISLGVAASIAYGAADSRTLAQTGAMFQMFSHGIITAILFGSVGVIEHHAGTRIIEDLGGLTKRMPKLAFLMLTGFMASLGLPGMSGFVAEFSILAGSYPQLPVFVLAAMASIALVAAYHLWAIQRALFGPFNEYLGNITDAKWFEVSALAALVLITLFLGIYPMPVYDMMHTTAAHLIADVLPAGGIP